MIFEYSRMNLTVETDIDHSVELLDELNRLGKDCWLLVSKIGCCDNGNGTETYSAIIVRPTQRDGVPRTGLAGGDECNGDLNGKT